MMRLLILVGAASLAAICLLALPFEEHVVSYERTETILGETDGVPFGIVVLVLVAAIWAIGGGFPRGAVAGVAIGGGGFFAAVTIAAQHILSDPIYNLAGELAFVSLLGLLVLGAGMVIVEPVLQVLERRRLEASDPVFPTARVV